MIGMDQFKDLDGFTRYAARLQVGPGAALVAWLYAGFNAVFGDWLWLGPRTSAWTVAIGRSSRVIPKRRRQASVGQRWRGSVKELL